MKSINRLKNWGPTDTDYFWFHLPHNLEYQVALQIQLFCSFDYALYPFDVQKCDFSFGSIGNSVSSMIISPPRIVAERKTLNLRHQNETGFLDLKQSILPFDIRFRILPPFRRWQMGFYYSHAGVQIAMRRNSLGLLMGGFYLPTAIFSCLSLISFAILPEAVPGRLGLLVTLSLIATNVYGSVKGPRNRGFSFIEVWMIGVHIPILLALFEYATILAMKKYQHYNKLQVKCLDRLIIQMDQWTFLFTLSFILLFYSVYWAFTLSLYRHSENF